MTFGGLTPNGNYNAWGPLLLSALSKAHNDDGSLKAVVCAFDFSGIDPTGTNDSTTGLQTAITQVGTAKGILLLPPGIYKYSSTLTDQTDITIQGSGPGATILQQISTTAHGIYASSSRRMNFRDLQLLGPGSGSGSGIYLDTSGPAIANCEFRNVLVQQFGADGIFMNAPIATAFSNVRSQNNGGHGFRLYNGTSISMDACYAAGVVDAGFFFDTMTYCSLNGCASDSNGAGYWFHGGGNTVCAGCGAEALQKNNSTYNGYGFVLDGATQITLIDCYDANNPSIAYWATNGATLGMIQTCREANPAMGATASIQVDAGCSAMVVFPSAATPANYASGTTSFFATNGVQSFGPGTNIIRASGGSANFKGVAIATAGIGDEWGLQEIDSTHNFHLKDLFNIRDHVICYLSSGITQLAAGFAKKLVTKSANYAIQNTDHNVLVDTTAGAITVTLPTAATLAGQEFLIKDWRGTAMTNNITIAAAGGQTIDGAASQIINANYGKMRIASDGTNWSIVG